jgi:hypothetical protein
LAPAASRKQDSTSDSHTVANAKGIRLDLLNYFASMPDKLFVAITAPPLSVGTYADNARAFNPWFTKNWLADYPLDNVFVWDFYNVLTSNGGGPEVSFLERRLFRLFYFPFTHSISCSTKP